MKQTVLYRDSKGAIDSLLVDGTPEQCRMLSRLLTPEDGVPRPAPKPIKEYALERQFGIKRRNGAFV